MKTRREAMEHIQKYYRVPAEIGACVRYTHPATGVPHKGTVVGADNAQLIVVFDGETMKRRYHPTWQMEYLDA